MNESEKRLLSTTDAVVWTNEFIRIAQERVDRDEDVLDWGWLISWFANAIEVGREAGRTGER